MGRMMVSMRLWQPRREALIAAITITLLALLVFLLYARRKQTSWADAMTVKSIYVYPVKGLRGCSLPAAIIGQYGFEYDRTFCLQKVSRDKDSGEPKFETMYIGYHLRLALFSTSFETSGSESTATGDLIVTWTGDDDNYFTETQQPGAGNQIRFPLQPDLKILPTLEANLHGSPTIAYDMGPEATRFFSHHLGHETCLVYIGQNSREVLGSIAPSSKAALSKSPSSFSRLLSMLPSFMAPSPERLVFNDIAHYLVVAQESNDQVSSRLADESKMDVTKFRPNIVLEGSPAPFAEDYWAELAIINPQGGKQSVKMALTANCYRCQSITVDYATGKPHEDDRGQVWKKLNKDRRVDKGAKYSPVFGRYGFCGAKDKGCEIVVGMKAVVTKRNRERTIFDWPHLTSFGTS